MPEILGSSGSSTTRREYVDFKESSVKNERDQTCKRISTATRTVGYNLDFGVLLLTLLKWNQDFVTLDVVSVKLILASFGERRWGLSDEAFRTQVTALVKPKQCEDAHLGEEMDHNWFEVVSQQWEE
ncbi:Nardilysin [Scophthalmus maximus]|uniref:Nardilysin n=1 Tax=Scophthalmus maximus TaxID=52904 RepID=A0A2U9CQM9_SCOMX|nr:Nardilysin [Scophthalmus maximus]